MSNEGDKYDFNNNQIINYYDNIKIKIVGFFKSSKKLKLDNKNVS
jgi:hypothetical protein